MRTIFEVLFLVCLAVSAVGNQQYNSSTKRNGYNRWAIIADPSVKKTGLDDLVFVSIQKIKGIDLVEREHLNMLLKEQTLSSSSVSERVRVGRLLGADALILLSIKRNKIPCIDNGNSSE